MADMTSVTDVFKQMADEVDAEAIKDMNVVLQFDISGDDGGQWVVEVKDGTVKTEQGTHANPDTTLMLSDKDFLGLVNGSVNPVTAFMQGLIKIDGDMAVALKLQNLL